jgi:ATP-binding cassette subfamily F protein 3
VEFGATTLFQDITVTIARGERWGVVGRNGTGKTTLFKLLTGELAPSRGQVVRQPGVRVTLLEQHRDFGDATTVWEAVADAFAPLRALEKSLAEQAEAMQHDGGGAAHEAALERYGHDLERFERDGGYEYEARVDAVLRGLGFDHEEARTRPLAALSGGERGRVGLARQLVLPGDVLLLDEPTNHLDLDTTRWLEQYLRNTDRTVVLISHDRAFLAAVVDHVLHFEAGTATPYAGTYDQFVVQRTERRLAQQRQFDKQQRVIAAEEDYIRRNIAGQNSKQAKGRRKRLERVGRLSPPPGEEGVMALRLEASERGGDQVLVADRVTVTVHGAQDAAPRVLVEDFSARVTRGEVVGLLGPNGSGKSTLLRAIVGERAQERGALKVGDSVRVAYYRQDLAQVPLDKTIYDVIADLRPAWERRLVQGHLGRFGFSGDEVQRRAGTLSGGERARLALAMMMLTRANFLILDEPTNHLDVESVEALEDAIEAYDGTVLLVSHDRALLQALVTTVWSLDEARITVFDGPFDEWDAQREERARAAAARRSEEAARRAEREQRERDRERERAERQRAAEQAASASSAPGSRRDAERDQRRTLREAQRRAEAAERRVAELEERITGLATALEEPALYDTPDGARKAAELGRQLDEARSALEGAMAEWAEATELVEAMA